MIKRFLREVSLFEKYEFSETMNIFNMYVQKYLHKCWKKRDI